MAWTTPRTWVAGEVPTAAIFNAHVRDNEKALTEWQTSWTPSWTAATTNPVVNNGTLIGRYITAGKLVHFYVSMLAGSTTTFGSGLYSIDLPVTEATTGSPRWTFSGHLFDSSLSDVYPIVGVRVSADKVDLKVDSTTAGNGLRNFTASAPVALALADSFFISGTYEAA